MFRNERKLLATEMLQFSQSTRMEVGTAIPLVLLRLLGTLSLSSSFPSARQMSPSFFISLLRYTSAIPAHVTPAATTVSQPSQAVMHRLEGMGGAHEYVEISKTQGHVFSFLVFSLFSFKKKEP